MLGPTMIHRCIQFPPPERRAPDYAPLNHLSVELGTLEIARSRDGAVGYVLASGTGGEQARLEATLQRTFPGMRFATSGCPMDLLRTPAPWPTSMLFLRARRRDPLKFPLAITEGTDYGDLLLRLLRTLPPVEVRVQVLHEPAGLRHVEIRAFAVGAAPAVDEASQVLTSWLGQFNGSSLASGFHFESVRDRWVRSQGTRFLRAVLDHDIRPLRSPSDRRYFSSQELAHLLSLPWESYHPELTYVPAPDVRAPPVASIPAHWLTIGSNDGREVHVPEPWHHLAVIGATRTGKSSILQALALQILARRPEARVVVLDPHGTLLDGIRGNLPDGLAQETVSLDPANNAYEVGGVRRVACPLNPLYIPKLQRRDPGSLAAAVQLVTNDLVQTFRNVWGEEMVGARIEHFLGLTLKGLLEVEGTNLVDAYLVLTQKDAAKRLAEVVRDPTVKAFLTTELPSFLTGPKRDVLLSTLNKLGKVTSNPILRETLCQRDGAVSIADLLRHRLLLVNLSKGRLGTDTSRFLGSVILTELWMAVLRYGSPRTPVYLVADEFQNFASDSFATILSESAKYGLHLVLANQYLRQVPRDTLAAVRGNVDAWAFLRLSSEDAEVAHEIARADRVGLDSQHTARLPDHTGLVVGQRHVASFQTWPATAPPPSPDALAAMRRTTAAFSTIETSLFSPLGDPGGVDLGGILGRFEDANAGPVLREQALALQKALSKGFLEETDPLGKLALTPLGRTYLQAVRARRPGGHEGDEHSELLARMAVYLKGLGVDLKIVDQAPPGIPLADGEFEHEGMRYTVEVESTTVTNCPSQVVKNLRKGVADGRKVVFVVQSEEAARELLAVVGREVASALNDRDFAVMVPRGEGFARFPGGSPDPLLPSGTEVGPTSPIPDGSPPPTSPVLGDLERVRDTVVHLQEQGGEMVTSEEVLEALPEEVRCRLPPDQLGRHLNALGVRSSRIRMGDRKTDRKVRVYDVKNWTPSTTPTPATSGRTPEGDPTPPTAGPHGPDGELGSPRAGLLEK